MLRTILSRFQVNSSNLRRDICTEQQKDDQRSVPEKKVVEKEDQISESHEQHKVPDTTEFLGKIVYAEICNSDKNQIFTVSSNDIEYDVFLKDINWYALVGDNVKCSAIVKINKEDGNELEVLRMVPRKKSIEYARVTAINDNHAIFDNRIILYNNTVKDSRLKLFAEYKIEMIESDQKGCYSYRVISILERMDSNIIGTGIVFENSPFKIYLNLDEKKEIGMKHIKIFNRSDKSANIKRIEIVPFLPENSDIISYKKSNMNFSLNPKIGQFKVFFKIQPMKIGKFYFNLVVLFSNFEEKYEFSVEIFKAYMLPGEKLFRSPRFIDVPISEHAIPNDIKEIDYSNYKEAKQTLENLYPSLKESLTPMNYLERMKLGIFLDELAMKNSFANYHIERAVFEVKGEYLKLTVKDVAEKRPSIIVGDKVIATDPTKCNNDENPIYEGYIHKVGNDSILCKFHSDFHEHHAGKDYSIDFIFSRSLFRRQHHALEKFTSHSSLGYNFLFPNKKIAINTVQLDAEVDTEGSLIIGNRQQNWFYNDLNKYQKSAVVNVLRGENRPFPYIFFGCPGSGKTQTVIETILQIQQHVRSSKIIIATPSNSAANLILEMLISSGVLDVNNPKFLRIVSNNQVEKELIPDKLTKYCGTVSIASDKGSQNSDSPSRNKSGILQNLTRSKIKEYQIIIATLNGIGNLMQMSFDSYFSHVIIDEAGQSIEAESIIPLTLLNSKIGQCILSGDPKQLGPIAITIFAKSFNFSVSMIERLLLTDHYYAKAYGPDKNDYDSKFVTKLIINYRSHPSVLKVYNDIFYDGELEGAVNGTDSIETLFLSTMEDLLWKNVNTKCGIIFVNVINGQNKKIQDSCSWFNDEEINGVMAFIKKCHAKKIPFKNIGILTPYSLQVKKLKTQISVLNDSDLKVGTVEEFQGQERLIMLVSTVRTEQKQLKKDNRFGLGFLQCPKRINVAISRARALLVIFGKQSILEQDVNWKRIIDYTKDNKTFVTESY
ncbi:unnamed protein product [Chironomus riparius]|uniref:RNA helicase n=1 Tax=Chironomus riparius TaxID=315576 RepID=A0A9N9RSD7_9DIPT|nr:unnamed protein product [Chironomus riparius]